MLNQINRRNPSLSIGFFAILFIGAFSTSFGQKVLKDIPVYTFLDSTLNKISYPSDEIVLNGFFTKLDALIKKDNGKINIVHIGGSHIQADVYSNQLRTNLLNFHPNLVGQRGLIFPFSAAGTNNPRNYQTTFKGIWETTKNTQKDLTIPLGLSGISITTRDSLPEISISLRQPENYRLNFNRVRVIGKKQNYQAVIYTDSLHANEAVYDSISSSFVYTFDSLQEQFTLKLNPLDSIRSFTIEGILLENDTSGVTYHSIGVNGASTNSYLKCVNLERDLALIQPDLVILSIGINDASGEEFDVEKFKANYRLLIQRIRSVAPQTSLLFTTNNDSYRKKGRKYYVNTNGLLAREAFFELAQTEHAAVWDLFSIMGGLHAMKEWETAGLAQKDKIHFNAEGYIIIGDLLFNALISDYLYRFF
jgi:lysophospholipase L1-like esterase